MKTMTDAMKIHPDAIDASVCLAAALTASINMAMSILSDVVVKGE